MNGLNDAKAQVGEWEWISSLFWVKVEAWNSWTSAPARAKGNRMDIIIVDWLRLLLFLRNIYML